MQSAEEVEGSAEELVAALKTAAVDLELVLSAAQTAAEVGRRTVEAEADEDAPEVGTAAEVDAVPVVACC